MKVYHDIHTHSLLSQCCYDPEATVENYCLRAKELGHKVFGVSNHLWDEKVPGASSWYQKQMINYGIEGTAKALPKLDGIKLLVGTESEYCAMTDTLGILPETGKRFDYVLIPHTHMHMKNFVMRDLPDVTEKKAEFAQKILSVIPSLSAAQAAKMTEALHYTEVEALLTERKTDSIAYAADFMEQSFKSLIKNGSFQKLCKAVPTSVAHAFYPCGYGAEQRALIINSISDEKYAECFSMARDVGAYIEINTASFTNYQNDFQNEPLIRVMRIARECGCLFTFGTDTHTLAGLSAISRGERISELCGITENELAPHVQAP